MPVTFEMPDDLTTSLVADCLQRWHRPLFDAGVKLGVLMARSDSPEKQALMNAGWPIVAKLRIVSLKDRLVKDYDAELVISFRAWTNLPPSRRVALIDHELSRLELKNYSYRIIKDADDQPTGERELCCDLDDQGRPKLKIRRGDWCVGEGFQAVIDRHGSDALEYRELMDAHSMVQEVGVER